MSFIENYKNKGNIIRLIEKQKSILENQQNSLKIIYDEFIKKQKDGLENFITTFSGKINEFYQFMNPNEPFQEIKIVTIGDKSIIFVNE